MLSETFTAIPRWGNSGNREVARMSPMRYAKQQRLFRARVLLLGDTRVSEVAHEVGYRSPAQFARDFKASYGLPPAAYAQRFRAPIT